jgi:hypothetical protein
VLRTHSDDPTSRHNVLRTHYRDLTMTNAPEPNQEALEAFIVRAGFTFGWHNLESWARRMAEQAVAEQQTSNEVPPMPPIKRYGPQESDRDLVLNNLPAIRWLVRNHEAIRTALTAVAPLKQAKVPEALDESSAICVNRPNTFASGWNACRESMLAAAPEVQS